MEPDVAAKSPVSHGDAALRGESGPDDFGGVVEIESLLDFVFEGEELVFIADGLVLGEVERFEEIDQPGSRRHFLRFVEGNGV